MRARRWIAPLLLVVSTTTTRAGAAPDPTRVGTLVLAKPEVYGTMPREQPVRLAKLDAVNLTMEVATGSGASARIDIDGGPAFGGTVVMGPKSRVAFVKWVVDRVDQVTRSEVGLWTQVGHFQLYFKFKRSPLGVAAGTVWIKTPRGPIRLTGTAVCLTVETDGTTTVAVLEGEVTAGSKVRVVKGSQTRVAPAFTSAAAQLVEDPPHLDLQRLLLLGNLPKARHP
jgi:hypothetical protein